MRLLLERNVYFKDERGGWGFDSGLGIFIAAASGFPRMPGYDGGGSELVDPILTLSPCPPP
jgi:hypothetical protein